VSVYVKLSAAEMSFILLDVFEADAKSMKQRKLKNVNKQL